MAGAHLSTVTKAWGRGRGGASGARCFHCGFDLSFPGQSSPDLWNFTIEILTFPPRLGAAGLPLTQTVKAPGAHGGRVA